MKFRIILIVAACAVSALAWADGGSFVEICKSPTLAGAQKHTIVEMLLQAGTQDCDQANEYLGRLSILSLRRNHISDLSPVAWFPNIVDLRLFDNQISDISPLAKLTNLQSLTLGRNAVADLAPLKGLTSLNFLSLFDNAITDVRPLAGLTSLTRLELGCNRGLADVSSLGALTNLQTLYLTGTQVREADCPLVNGQCLFLPTPDDPCPVGGR